MLTSEARVRRMTLPRDFIRHPTKIKQSSVLCKDIYYQHKVRTIKRNNDTLFVCFKGCSNVEDFLTSMDIRSCKIEGNMIGIHNGFCERSKAYRDEIESSLLRACEKGDIKHIVYTGHSAGGCVAEITAVLTSDIIADSSIIKHCYTFGSPKAGDEVFKDAIEHICKDNVVRVEMYNDLVCLLPMQPQFTHVGDALIFKDCKLLDSFNLQNIEKMYQFYPNEYMTLLTDLRDQGMFNKKAISRMIEEHSMEHYVQCVKTL